MAMTITNLVALTETAANEIEALVDHFTNEVPTPEIAIIGATPYWSYRVRRYSQEFWATAQRLVAQGIPVKQLTPEIVAALRGGFSPSDVNGNPSLKMFGRTTQPAEVTEVPVESAPEDNSSAPASEPLSSLADVQLPLTIVEGGSKGGEVRASADTPAVRKITHSCGCLKTVRLTNIDRSDKVAVAAEVARLTAVPCKKHQKEA